MFARLTPFLPVLAALAVAGCGPGDSGAASSASGATAAAVATPAAPSGVQPIANPVPINVGDCVQTTVQQVGTRLEGTPGSGSAIEYSNRVTQVSYDQVPGIDSSRPGDAVKLCLVSLPQNCPPGDDRGKVYAGTNLRTGQTWSEPDSEHSCGGA